MESFVPFHVFPNIDDLTPNFSPWWKNKMASNHNLLSIGVIHRVFSLCMWYTDVNECLEGLDSCPMGRVCVNLPGSYQCDCYEGFTYNASDGNCYGRYFGQNS